MRALRPGPADAALIGCFLALLALAAAAALELWRISLAPPPGMVAAATRAITAEAEATRRLLRATDRLDRATLVVAEARQPMHLTPITDSEVDAVERALDRLLTGVDRPRPAPLVRAAAALRRRLADLGELARRWRVATAAGNAAAARLALARHQLGSAVARADQDVSRVIAAAKGWLAAAARRSARTAVAAAEDQLITARRRPHQANAGAAEVGGPVLASAAGDFTGIEDDDAVPTLRGNPGQDVAFATEAALRRATAELSSLLAEDAANAFLSRADALIGLGAIKSLGADLDRLAGAAVPPGADPGSLLSQKRRLAGQIRDVEGALSSLASDPAITVLFRRLERLDADLGRALDGSSGVIPALRSTADAEQAHLGIRADWRHKIAGVRAAADAVAAALSPRASRQADRPDSAHGHRHGSVGLALAAALLGMVAITLLYAPGRWGEAARLETALRARVELGHADEVEGRSPRPAVAPTADVEQMLSGLLQRYGTRAGRLGIDLSAEATLPAPRLGADGEQLAHVIDTLTSVQMSLCLSGDRVTVRAVERRDGGLAVSLRHTGIGLRPRELGTALGGGHARDGDDEAPSALIGTLARSHATVRALGGEIDGRAAIRSRGRRIDLAFPPGRVTRGV